VIFGRSVRTGRAGRSVHAGRAVAYGLGGWVVVAVIVASILVVRQRLYQDGRSMLPAVAGKLTVTERSAWARFPAYTGAVPVLVYHGIGTKPSYITESGGLFAAQMRALKTGGFHSLTIAQYVAYTRGDTKGLPSRPILLTFDDGRLDAYRDATPILREYGMHAVAFVVPGWVTAHPNFALNWPEILRMQRSGTWDIQLHFGYGPQDVPYDKYGNGAAVFSHLEYFPAQDGQPARTETFSQFEHRVISNFLFGIRELHEHIPGYRQLGEAVPESNYGQQSTNDLRIPPFVLGWLHRHFETVFGGDWLETGPDRPYQITDRYSRQLSYRMSMGPKLTLPVLRCRLLNFVEHTPLWHEYRCYHAPLPPHNPYPPVPPVGYGKGR
jgi:peptidoglycan/xylan/chitin deacetylase (PgdA/CDA1 family)